MKHNRFQYEYKANASKLHKAVGEALRTYSLFAIHEIYQEYPVEKINPSYVHKGHHFDWVIPSLKLVIECMGIQHYQVETFGADTVTAIDNFRGTVQRDQWKREACEDVGYIYLVVKYDEEKRVNGEMLWARYVEQLFRTDVENTCPKIINRIKKTYRTDCDKEKMREYRKQKYQRMKEWKRKYKEKA